MASCMVHSVVFCQIKTIDPTLKIVEIDSVLRSATAPLPFDEPFYLKMWFHSEPDVSSIRIFYGQRLIRLKKYYKKTKEVDSLVKRLDNTQKSVSRDTTLLTDLVPRYNELAYHLDNQDYDKINYAIKSVKSAYKSNESATSKTTQKEIKKSLRGANASASLLKKIEKNSVPAVTIQGDNLISSEVVRGKSWILYALVKPIPMKKDYAILVYSKLSSDILARFKEIGQCYIYADSYPSLDPRGIKATAMANYDLIRDETRNIGEYANPYPLPDTLSFVSILKVNPKFKTLNDQVLSGEKCIVDSTLKLNQFNKTLLPIWIKWADDYSAVNEIIRLTDSLPLKPYWEKNAMALIPNLMKFYECLHQRNAEIDKQIIEGVLEFPFKVPYLSPGDKSFEQRRLNLQKSIQNITALKAVADYYYIETKGTNIYLQNWLGSTAILLTNLKAGLDLLHNISVCSNQILDCETDISNLFAPPSFVSAININGQTMKVNFKDTYAALLRPDFGVAYASSIWNFKSSKSKALDYTVVEPYVGLRWSFWAFNHDLPIKKQSDNRGIQHHLFGSIALGLASVDNGKEIKNLFTKYPLLIGIGFRITPALAINAGSMLFRIDDPSPVVSRYELAGVPYVSLSWDLDLNQVAATIGNIFAPGTSAF